MLGKIGLKQPIIRTYIENRKLVMHIEIDLLDVFTKVDRPPTVPRLEDFLDVLEKLGWKELFRVARCSQYIRFHFKNERAMFIVIEQENQLVVGIDQRFVSGKQDSRFPHINNHFVKTYQELETLLAGLDLDAWFLFQDDDDLSNDVI